MSALSTRRRSSHATNTSLLYKRLTRQRRFRHLSTPQVHIRFGQRHRQRCSHCKRRPHSGVELTRLMLSPLTAPICSRNSGSKPSSISPPISTPGFMMTKKSGLGQFLQIRRKRKQSRTNTSSLFRGWEDHLCILKGKAILP